MQEGIGQRIKILRDHLKLSQKQFGESIGHKQENVFRWEKDVVRLTDRNAQIICEKYGVNPKWLMEGKGEMFLQRNDKIEISATQAYQMYESEKNRVDRLLKTIDSLTSELDRQGQLIETKFKLAVK